jgi:hypothetical protein
MSKCHSRWHSEPGALAGALLFAVFAITIVAGSASAEPPYPRYGVRTVDGEFGDWRLHKDFFASMYRAGKDDKPLESSLYLRYSCPTNTLYILVLSQPNVPVVPSEEDAWVALDGISNKLVTGDAVPDGKAPDFAWVKLEPGLGGYDTIGYEASIPLMPGRHELHVHVNVWGDNEEQTSATAGFTNSGVLVLLDCAVPVEETSWGMIKGLYR